MDLDADDSLDDALLPVATKTERPPTKFRPQARPKTRKPSSAQAVVAADAAQTVPPPEPRVVSTEQKRAEDESSLSTSEVPVTQPEASNIESSVLSGNNDEAVLSLTDSRREVADTAFDSDPLDLIHPPTTVKAVGRFQPKAKGHSRGEELIKTSTAGLASEDRMDADRLEVSQSEGLAFNGDNTDILHYNQEESKMVQVCSPVSETVSGDNQPALTTGGQGSSGPSVVNSSGFASVSILLEPQADKEPVKMNSDRVLSVEASEDGPQASKSDLNLHSQLVEPGALDLLSDVSPICDALFSSKNTIVKQAGKFKPKLIPRPKVLKDNQASFKAPNTTETVASPIDLLAPSQSEGAEEPSFLQMLGEGSPNETSDSTYTMSGYNSDIHMNHGKSGEEDTSLLSGLESFENILAQSTPITVSAGELQQNLDSLHYCQTQRDSVSMEPESLVCHAPDYPSCSLLDSLTIGTCYSMPTDSTNEQEYHIETPILEPTPGKDDPIIGEEETLTLSKNVDKEFQFHDAEGPQKSLDENSSWRTVEAVGTHKSSKRTRKRINVTSASDDRANSDFGFDGTDISQIDEVHNDVEYRGEEEPKKKRVPRKPKREMTENEKPVRKRKKASEEATPTVEEPVKKKFPHATRRKRRQVSKVLLETPEDEIDPRQLSIKDLIMLAEAKEKISSKEAAALKKTNPSKSSFQDGSHFAEDNYFETNEQHLNLDGDEANNDSHLTSTKLNYHTFMRRSSSRWSKSEVELLYQAIRQFGTDFAMIQKLFPDKTRHQIKLKFKNEERKHPLEVADALIHRTKDRSQFELVMEQLRKEAEEKARNEAFDDPEATLQDMVPGNKEECEQPYKDEEQVGDWNVEAETSAKFDEYGDYFGWDATGSSPQDMEKDSYKHF